jgi:hypothetical protein
LRKQLADAIAAVEAADSRTAAAEAAAQDSRQRAEDLAASSRERAAEAEAAATRAHLVRTRPLLDAFHGPCIGPSFLGTRH